MCEHSQQMRLNERQSVKHLGSQIDEIDLTFKHSLELTNSTDTKILLGGSIILFMFVGYFCHLTTNGFADSLEIFTIYITYISVFAPQVSRLNSQGSA